MKRYLAIAMALMLAAGSLLAGAPSYAQSKSEIVIALDADTQFETQTIARLAREVGLTVPNSDLVIAACARRHDAAVEHCDRHFDDLQKLLAKSTS